MVIQPNTDITLYSGVDIGTCQQLAFSSLNKQKAYFQTKILKQYVNCTVVKEKIGTLKVAVKPVGQTGTGEITGAELASANYMSFINPSFDNKTIYCYIVDYVYLNNETAEIHYMIDYWQTWLFDVTFEPMYIDREHLSQADWAKIQANPYDPTVPQMITAEPLPVGKALEKPFYDIAWFDANKFAKDGQALLSCRTPVSDYDNGTIISILDGSWKYWNAMLIQAPTDWTKFGTYDELDEGSDAAVWNTNDICYHGDEFFVAQSDTSGGFDATKWSNITPSVDNYDNDNLTIPVDTSVTSCQGNHWVLSYEGKLYRNKSSSAVGFSYLRLAQDPGFEEVPYAVYSNMPNPNKVEGELLSIRWFFRMAYIDAGSDLLDDLFHQTAAVALNGQAYMWSTKPHGCDVLCIRNSDAWKRLTNFYARYNAISQIIGIYGVPAAMFNLGTLDQLGSMIPTLNPIGNSDDFRVETSYMRMNSEIQPTVRNRKLLTAPFSYLRIISPDGQVKEFNYEKFNQVALDNDGNVSAAFRIVADISGDMPKLYLIPFYYDRVDDIGSAVKDELDSDYNGLGTAWERAMHFNMDEAICVTGFPEISFNTDGYLTFLGSEYAATRAADTTENRINLEIMKYQTKTARNLGQSFGNFLSSVTGGAATGAKGGSGTVLAGAVAGGFEGGVGFIDTANTTGLNQKKLNNIIDKYEAAAAWGNGSLLSTDNPNLERFAQAKAAYANDMYVGGTGGVIRYMRGMGLFDFVALNVQLRPEILDYYDKWFDLYGYSSGRCGIPYVIQFCRGGSDMPHWVDSNGVAPDTTYIKTFDCKVEHAMLPVANAIAQMFNEGVRMKKGDLS